MENISVQVIIQSDIRKVWKCWTEPQHISKWNFATSEWHCPDALNDLRPGGKFSWRMEAKDGSMGFDFSGTYNTIDNPNSIHKTLDDGRKVSISFKVNQNETKVIESFEPDENNPELQKQGWQAILNNFKVYVEALKE